MIRFTISISDELNSWLEEQARLNHRSKIKQVEHLLQEAMSSESTSILTPLARAVLYPKGAKVE